MDITELAKIIAILKENGVTEFELQQEGTHIKLARASSVAPAGFDRQSAVQPAVSLGHPTSSAINGSNGASHVSVVEDSNLHKVESPIVGTFYARPSPDKDVFVKQGDSVKKGDTLCIVEAMKLMNEIEAPFSGKIERVIPSDGQVVEFGEVLFLINPKG